MSGERILADTNILIRMFSGEKMVVDFLSGADIHVSFITEIENTPSAMTAPTRLPMMRKISPSGVVNSSSHHERRRDQRKCCGLEALDRQEGHPLARLR